jgi:hypothetical protein
MDEFVRSFAHGMKVADGLGLQAVSQRRTGKSYKPGIGPHSEPETVNLSLAHSGYPLLESASTEEPYPADSRRSCDVVIAPPSAWAIEVKMLRLMRDNGNEEESALKHILSPYSAHHSAVTDCPKLLGSGFEGRKGIVIFGYDYDKWPMDPVIEAFETLASPLVGMKMAAPSTVADLIHPVHRSGRVFGWEITALREPPRVAR